MADMFKNLGELKSAVGDYLNYGDESVQRNIPLFINIAITETNRHLRTPAQEVTVYHEVTQPIVNINIPSNLLELRRIYYGDTLETLNACDLEILPSRRCVGSEYSNDGRPMNYARNGRYWVLSGPAVVGTKLFITYYADQPYIDDDTATFVLLQQCGPALLYRAIAEGYRFLEDLEKSEYYMNKAIQEIELIQEHSRKSELAGTVIVQMNSPW